MLELAEILEEVIHNIARESQTHRGLAEWLVDQLDEW